MPIGYAGLLDRSLAAGEAGALRNVAIGDWERDNRRAFDGRGLVPTVQPQSFFYILQSRPSHIPLAFSNTSASKPHLDSRNQRIWEPT